MARVTVEDCLDHVDNRFDLVLLATKRARQLSNGVAPLLAWENDKATVVALREIAAGLVDDQVVAPRPEPEVDMSNLDDNFTAEDVVDDRAFAK